MTAPAASPVFYFDVTDVVHHAFGNARVTGIQRVQLNLLTHMVRRHGGDVVRCTFEHPSSKAMVEVDSASLCEGNEFDAEVLLRRLGISEMSRIIPSKTSIRRYLRRYDKTKLRRALAKADIVISAVFFPRRLATWGLHRPTEAERAVVPVDLRPIDRLPSQACLVILGATWLLPRIVDIGRQHAARGGAVVQLIYDLIPQVHPEYFARQLADEFNHWLNEIVAFTRRFICISQWTAADLRRFIGPREDVRIDAVAMAHEFAGFERYKPVALSGGEALDAADRPFVLCVGTLEVRKNGAALLQAWRVLAKRMGERLPRLVFAGKQGWLIQEFKATLDNDPDLARHVRIVDSPSDHELAYLYRRCLFAAYPSLYEGWGLPVGEAAWFGKYVISSNATSLPEVCGDLIDYFDPAYPEALCTRLERAITEPDYVRRKEAAIAASPMRTWAQVADNVYALIVAQTMSRPPVAALDSTEPA